MRLAHCFLIGLSSALLPLAALAQWQWIDGNGKAVFSDQPPPASVPEKNIVRRGSQPAPRPTPNVTVLPGADTTTAAAPAAATAPAAAAPKAEAKGVDKELEEKIRKEQEAEKAKQAAEAQKIAQARAENCRRARESKATYDSGMRVARINAQGEREIMDDAQRAAEQKRLQTVIDSDCKVQ